MSLNSLNKRMNFKNGKTLLFLCLLCCLQNLKSQNGLENIIVEKYYISNANDTSGSLISGFLPIGSVTYRVFIDMLPGYRFHAAYGSPTHELKIQTSTQFFNNEDIGNTTPNVIPRRTLHRNTVMLDSWLSAGSAGENFYGILKEQDDAIETIVPEKLYLKNNDKRAGIPVSERDGLLSASDVPNTVLYGIDNTHPAFFNSTKGSDFSTTNGAWGCLGGAIGPDSLTTNRLLIAQLTTNGDLAFELNIQIGKRDGPTENYVAKNPTGKEILLPALIYHSEPKINASKTPKPNNKK